MMKFLLCLSVSILWTYCSSVQGVDDFCPKIWNCLCQMTKQQRSHTKISSYNFTKWHTNMTEPEIFHYLIPKILLWDPMNQFPLLVKKMICPQHSLELHVGPWRCTPQSRPRWLYDLDGPVLLVMRTYICRHQSGSSHNLLSGEECITQQLPTCIEVPFQLSHRAGFTCRLQVNLKLKVSSGMNFWNIEEQLQNEALHSYVNNRRQYCMDTHQWFIAHPLHKFHKHEFPTFEKFLQVYHPCPSDNYLKDIFIHHFQCEQSSYVEYMESLVAKYLSCDHTFKVSVNIGFNRPENGTWVTQYDSLFMVLNEIGQVLNYKLAKSTAFDNIVPILAKIRESLRNNGASVEIIALDNCCHWRKKMNSLYPEACIKLDLFHAIQRVTQHISKKSIFSKELSNNLSMVFRQNGDSGKKRLLDTPSKENMLLMFDKFVNKWSSVSCTDEKVLNDEALKAALNLRCHIAKGCLSGIPSGLGTNKNERLHHHLNKSALAIGRIGPELATAILVILLYKWNISRDKSQFNNGLMVPISSAFQLYKNNETEKMCWYHIPEKCPPVPAVCQMKINSISEDSKTPTKSSVLQEPSDDPMNDVIAETSMTLYSSFNYLQKHHGLQNTCSFDALLWGSHNIGDILSFNGSQSTETLQLQRNVSDLGMTLHSVPSDGNCLFVATMSSILKQMHDTVICHLKELHFDFDGMTIFDLATILRQLVVKEIENNFSFYNSFVSEQKLSNIKEYSVSGRSEGELGDLLVAGIASVLCVSICIVTGRSDVKVILQECRHKPLTSQPLFLAYDHSGPGHYSALCKTESKSEETNISSKSNVTPSSTSIDENKTYQSAGKGCRCGRSCKKHVASNKKYCSGIRCPCKKSGIACLEKCSCLSCNNPYGHKVGWKRTDTVTRKRRKTHVSFKTKKGSNYLIDNLESLSSGGWTKVEALVLYHVIKASSQRNNRMPSAATSTTRYNNVVYHLIASHPTLCLRNKTYNQVQHKQQHLMKKDSVFKTLTRN